MKIAVFEESLACQTINAQWDNWLLRVNDGKPFGVVSLTQQIVCRQKTDQPFLYAVLTYVPQSQTGIVGATIGSPQQVRA